MSCLYFKVIDLSPYKKCNLIAEATCPFFAECITDELFTLF